MAADAIIFVVLGIAPWSNPWTVLDDRVIAYVKTRVLALGSVSLGSES